MKFEVNKFNLISTSNYGEFNITLAHILGLHTAIYLNALLEIGEKAERKLTMDNGAIVVNRDYIESRTTLPVEEQLEIDKKLAKLDVLKIGKDPNMLEIDVQMIMSMFIADKPVVDNLKKVVTKLSKTKKQLKEEGIIFNLQKKVTTTQEELKSAYYEWINSVVSRYGQMSPTAVEWGQQLVDNYANHNLDLALYIVKLAAVHGDKDMKWTIDRYEKDYKARASIPQIVTTIPEVKISKEVF